MFSPLARILSVVSLLWVITLTPTMAQKGKCQDKLKEFLVQIPNLFEAGEKAKIDSTLDELHESCGSNEYSVRLKHLISIDHGTFSDVDFTLKDYQAVMSYIEDYRFTSLMDSVHEAPSLLYRVYFGEPELIFAFDRFTVKLALLILGKPEINSLPDCDLRKTLLYAYSNNLLKFRSAITNSDCHSRMAKGYQGQVESVSKKAMVDAALIVGYWIPYGKNEILGQHPSLGFLFGFGKKRMLYDLAMEFRFGSPNQPYTIQYKGAPLQTSHYFGGYIGFDIAYELKNYHVSKLYLLGGVALDGFDAVKGSKTVEGKSFFSLNVNGGVGWRLFSRDGAYLGLELRHNFNNYNNSGGTDLSGNSLTGRLLIGLLKNDSKKRQMDYLNRLVK